MAKIRIVRSSLLLALVFPMIGLVAGHVAAQAVDTKGDKELSQLTQKIDKSAANRDGGRVTSKIVDEWKGTKFKFDPNSAPRELTAQDRARSPRQEARVRGDVTIPIRIPERLRAPTRHGRENFSVRTSPTIRRSSSSSRREVSANRAPIF